MGERVFIRSERAIAFQRHTHCGNLRALGQAHVSLVKLEIVGDPLCRGVRKERGGTLDVQIAPCCFGEIYIPHGL